jgi:serine protease Do
VSKGYLGIATITLRPNLAPKLNGIAAEGVFVEAVLPDSPAAGILQGMPSKGQLGDIIISVDGKPVKDKGAFILAIHSHKPGEKVKLGIIRQGQLKDIEVVLGAPPGESTQR